MNVFFQISPVFTKADPINTTGRFLIQAIKHLFKKFFVKQPIQILKPVLFVLPSLVRYSSQ